MKKNLVNFFLLLITFSLIGTACIGALQELIGVEVVFFGCVIAVLISALYVFIVKLRKELK